ncbi:MAG: GNAT family N-acetyltransferase [Streptosporangiaceae bacterium]
MTGTSVPDAARSAAGVITAGEADVDVLSQVTADAFHDLPQSQWLISDPVARREIFPAYFRLYVELALAAGVVYTTPGRDAAALWISVGAGVVSPPYDYEARLATVTGPWLGRFQAFDGVLDEHHPVGVPHHHLAILAVRPDRQGRGIGTTLLRAHHRVLDRDAHVAAYLEAASPRTCRTYQRHGYVHRSGEPFRLPDGGPPMWPMWREPLPSRTHKRGEPAAATSGSGGAPRRHV